MRARNNNNNNEYYYILQIFIDELDAVGGARIATDVHPYARMTLNQLLVELDGYKENEEVVVIGATNFPESLDKALVRPGRFDVKINVPIPDLKARHDILKLYLEKVCCCCCLLVVVVYFLLFTFCCLPVVVNLLLFTCCC